MTITVTVLDSRVEDILVAGPSSILQKVDLLRDNSVVYKRMHKRGRLLTVVSKKIMPLNR